MVIFYRYRRRREVDSDRFECLAMRTDQQFSGIPSDSPQNVLYCYDYFKEPKSLCYYFVNCSRDVFFII